jgi:hypothetical protein
MAALPAGTGAADQIENRVQGLGEAGSSRRAVMFSSARVLSPSWLGRRWPLTVVGNDGSLVILLHGRA